MKSTVHNKLCVLKKEKEGTNLQSSFQEAPVFPFALLIIDYVAKIVFTPMQNCSITHVELKQKKLTKHAHDFCPTLI